jgi:hypothetical protein
VFIPAGCFKPGQDGFSVDGLGCRWPCATPRVTPFVSGFRAALAPQTLRRWKASVEIDVHTFNVYPTNPCAITFAVGDDGVTNGLLDSRTQLVGIVVPEM